MSFHSRKAFASTSILAIGLSTGGIVPVPFITSPARPAVASTVQAAPVAAAAPRMVETRIEVDVPVIPVGETPVTVSGPPSALIARADLTRAATIAAIAVERKNTFPILSNVMVKGAGNSVTVTGTDLDVEISVTVPGAADASLFTTMPADLLQKILRKAAGGEYVSMTADDGKANLDFERVKFDLQTIDANDFPVMDVGTVSNEFTMAGADFFTMIDRTADAISQEETRYYLNGIFMQVLSSGNRTSLVAVATDGHRLYRQEFEMPFGADAMPGVIIPRKMVMTLRKLMKGRACPASVTVQVNTCKMRVSFDDVVVTSKLIDGTFPDYQRVIPSQNDKRAQVSARAMLEALESVSLISSERGRAVKLELSAGRCRLVVNNPDSGSAVMDVDCLYDGDDLEIGFNAAYLTNALKDAASEADEITLDFRDAGSPALITCGRDGWSAVCMPMRV